jgi:uncharacterized protein YndB with AHSA1/START domain
MDKQPLIVERTFNAPVQKVWKAITEADSMRQWYFDIQSFKPEVGFAFQFTSDMEGRPYIHECEVTEAIPYKKISYSWSYKGFAGVTSVSFELFDEEGKTRLVLTHAGLHNFPANVPDLERRHFVQGWNYFLDERLKAFVEENTVAV